MVEGVPHAIFDIVDGDGDNTISKSEFKQLLDVWGVSAPDAMATFMRLDTDGDGVISRHEYIRAIREFFYSPDTWTARAVCSSGPCLPDARVTAGTAKLLAGVHPASGQEPWVVTSSQRTPAKSRHPPSCWKRTVSACGRLRRCGPRSRRPAPPRRRTSGRGRRRR
ncbi:EF-hand domain-containing protein [Amycolatopsis cynarae]|uniref:EF-hand domain-containing protein n=1 Tax=Amycolatopsis cynarae TaxID=2995223 RepID=UPI0038993687